MYPFHNRSIEVSSPTPQWQVCADAKQRHFSGSSTEEEVLERPAPQQATAAAESGLLGVATVWRGRRELAICAEDCLPGRVVLHNLELRRVVLWARSTGIVRVVCRTPDTAVRRRPVL